MIRGEGGGAQGHLARPGKRAGWNNLSRGAIVAYQTFPQGPLAKQLTLGKVLANDRENQTITVQPYRSKWLFVKIVHRPLYQGPAGRTTEPTGTDAKDTVRYEALVKKVSLLSDGEIGHSDSRELLKGNWMLRTYERQPGEALATLVCSASPPPFSLASLREDESTQVSNVKLGPTVED